MCCAIHYHTYCHAIIAASIFHYVCLIIMNKRMHKWNINFIIKFVRVAINSPPSYYNVFAAFDVLKLFTLQIRQFCLTMMHTSLDMCVWVSVCVYFVCVECIFRVCYSMYKKRWTWMCLLVFHRSLNMNWRKLDHVNTIADFTSNAQKIVLCFD